LFRSKVKKNFIFEISKKIFFSNRREIASTLLLSLSALARARMAFTFLAAGIKDLKGKKKF
jgi:hypothetical protein